MAMRDQFDSLVAAYIGAVGAGDAEAVARLYTEDALLLNPGYPPISGRQAIQEQHKESLGDGYNLTINIQDFRDHGDTAYAVGSYEAEGQSGKWLKVLQRQSDDSVLLHRVCTNGN